MKVTLNFEQGSIDGLFVVLLKNGTKIYATKLIKLEGESMLRCVTYFIKCNNNGTDAGGEMRPSLDTIDSIEIRGRKY